MHLHKKHVLIAGALAVEWILAFAFARRFANALADAQSAFAWANADADDVPRVRELQRRIDALERGHGIECGRPLPARLAHARLDPTLPG